MDISRLTGDGLCRAAGHTLPAAAAFVRQDMYREHIRAGQRGTALSDMGLQLIVEALKGAEHGAAAVLSVAAGGIFGKAVFAAVLNTIVLSLWAGKNPFARDANGQSLMTKATNKGMAKVAPFVIGLGVSLVLYYFFNVTSSTNNVMVGVMAAIGTIQAAQSSHGIIFSTVLFIIEKVSGGRTPSSSAVRNSLMGATAGFTICVPLTYLRQPLMIVAAGSAVLMLGILLAVLGQQKKPAQA